MKKFFYAILILGFSGFAVVVGILFYFNAQLPHLDTLKSYEPALITKVYDRNGKLITEYAAERRIIVQLNEMPKVLLDAFIAAEDDKFYDHIGIDVIGMARAVLMAVKTGAIKQGASTITQQVARSFFLTQKRELSRKIKEILLALKLERNLSKDEILFLYLNQIYLGRGAYGVGAAAEMYFGVPVQQLTLAQAAILAGLPPAPSRYAPHLGGEKARNRQLYVLRRMVETGRLSEEQAEAARQQAVAIREWSAPSWNAPWIDALVRGWLLEHFPADVVLYGGLTVYTTFDLEAQKSAQRSIQLGLEDLDKRQGYRGPITVAAKAEWPRLITQAGQETARIVQRRRFGNIIGWIGPAPTPPATVPVTNIVQPEDLFAGLVTGFDQQKKWAWVNFGLGIGRLPAQSMAWARQPDPKEVPSGVYVKSPADILKPGSLIWVRKYAPAYVQRYEAPEATRSNLIKELDQMAADQPNTLLLMLEQKPLAQGALVSLMPQSGEVVAVVGGYSFQESQFNRAVQAKRQPGSAFKPIVFSAALDYGFTPVSILTDNPVIYEDIERETTWKPKNYENEFLGDMTLVDALTYSRNLVTIQLVRDLGIKTVSERARALGIVSDLPQDLSMALGSGVVTPWELTVPYATFANLGKRPDLVFVREVWDATGKLVYSYLPPITEAVAIRFNPFEAAPPPGKLEVPFGLRSVGHVYAMQSTGFAQVISAESAYQMTYLLRNVVERGTGWRSKQIGHPSAGKTGTTDDNIDSWYAGYTCDFVTVVWVGFDQLQPLGRIETGSRAANPIWVDFMKTLVAKRPVCEFAVPSNIIFREVDAKTGKLATAWTSNKTLLVPFRRDQQPDAKTNAEQAGQTTPHDLFQPLPRIEDAPTDW